MTPPDQAGTTMGSSARARDSDTVAAVPSFISTKDLAQGDKLFFGVGRALRGTLGFLVGFMLIAAIATFAFTAERIAAAHPEWYDQGVDCAYHGRSCVLLQDRFPRPLGALPREVTPPAMPEAQYRTSLVLKQEILNAESLLPLLLGAVALPFFLSFLACVFRGKPARVVMLNASRPAGADIRKMIRRELRPYGHIIALQEGARGIDNDGRLGACARLIRNKLAMNLRAFFARNVTLPVRATTEWRPTTTQLLARSSDALIVDLSNGAPQHWEIFQPLASRCVFVSAWGQQDQAEAAFASLGLPGQCFFYAPDGEIQRRGQFRAAMLAAMRAAHA